MIGRDRVIWRYDPILLSDIFDKTYHYKWFEYLAKNLSKYTNKCVISFLDLYRKTKHNLKGIQLVPMDENDILEISFELSKIAHKYGLIIETCSENINLEKFDIKHGRCIDDKLISSIVGSKLNIDKDPNQRDICGCVKSIDIGAYNTCKHDCLYCYANFSKETVSKNISMHDKNSALLFGELCDEDKIIDRKMCS